MIWPTNLVTCALFNTLHSQQYAGIGTRGGISRERFFTYALIGAFCWYWVPGYLFTALSAFNWVCWIAPNNVVVNQLFGTMSGLSFTVLTFDWSQIAFIGSPLATPWWAAANISFSMVFFYCKFHAMPYVLIIMLTLYLRARDYLPGIVLHEHNVREVPAHGVLYVVRQHRRAVQRHEDSARRNH